MERMNSYVGLGKSHKNQNCHTMNAFLNFEGPMQNAQYNKAPSTELQANQAQLSCSIFPTCLILFYYCPQNKWLSLTHGS